jgi:hypothetical protein
MGYYTNYSLAIFKVVKGKAEERENPNSLMLIQELRKKNSHAEFALTESGESREECKWYDHQKDLIRFSKKHRNILFQLSGLGEDRDDMWVKYFLNGKYQVSRATIKYDKFNLKKLS